MTLDEVLKHFGIGPSELAEKLDVTPGAVSQWKDAIPMGRQWQIESLTGGKLKPDKKTGQAA